MIFGHGKIYHKGKIVAEIVDAKFTDAGGSGDSCGCPFCDLGIEPDGEAADGSRFHNTAKRGRILCTRLPPRKRPLQSGDIVRLKSYGPKMVVSCNAFAMDGAVVCHWITEHGFPHEGHYLMAELEDVLPEEGGRPFV